MSEKRAYKGVQLVGYQQYVMGRIYEKVGFQSPWSEKCEKFSL